MSVKTRVLATAALCALSVLLLARPVRAQNVSSFNASIMGVGWLFQYDSTTSAISPDPNAGIPPWVNLFGFGNLNPGGAEMTGYYMVGFNQAVGAPPAYIMMQEAGLGASAGDIVQVTGISGVFLVDPNGNALTGTPSATGADLYKGAPPSATPSSWNNWITVSQTGYFGYKDTQNGAGFASGDSFLGRTTNGVIDPTFGVFDFRTWTAGTDAVYLGMDVQLANGNTGRIYITDGDLDIVPEPAFYQMAGFLGLGGLSLLKLRRRRP